MIESTPQFSQKERAQTLQTLKEEEYDLLVIGGGITGAGILLDAASRGLKAALLEKGDFASGTSSRSTKLIHGGLRYLKQFDFWLVHEVGSERAIVHNLAPHLVVPEKMLLPLVEGGSYGKWLTSFGLKIYDMLAHVEGDDQRVMLEKQDALVREPLLPAERLVGAGYYAEYRTDDARLTVELIKKGREYGGEPLNYCEVRGFITSEDGKVRGVEAYDSLTSQSLNIRSRFVVNAAGPWVDELRGLDGSLRGKRLYLTKGVHVVVPYEKCPVKQSVYFDIPDGRMMFAIPRGEVTYLGTTDTPYEHDKNEVYTDLADAAYLIEATNQMFPDIELTFEDIESSWAGLRPLIYEEGKSASELSRKDETFVSGSGLISIAGGKLTGYRKMAERVVNKVAQQMKSATGTALPSCRTEEIPLGGNDSFANWEEVKEFSKEFASLLEAEGLPEAEVPYLVHNYGIQCLEIWERYRSNAVQSESPLVRLLMAELDFCLDNEAVATPADFFIRRTGRLYFRISTVREHLNRVADRMAQYFDWSDQVKEAYIHEMTEEVRKHSDFSPNTAKEKASHQE